MANIPEPEPSPPPITQMPLVELRDWWRSLRSSAEQIKGRIAEIEAELTRRFGASFYESLMAQNKLAGDHTWTADNDVKLKGTVSKKVDWDSDRLLQIAAGMSWSQAQALFTFKASMAEAIWKGIAAMESEELRKQISDARTVTYGEPKVAFVDKPQN